MRVLVATAVACLALAACGQADPLPPGMALRVTAADGFYSIAVPAGWSDTTADYGGLSPVQSGVHQLVVGPASEPKALKISSAQVPRGINGGRDVGGPEIHVTIAGELVTGLTSQGAVIVVVHHTVDGKALWFDAECPASLITRDTCLGILDSWRWETPSSSHVLLIATSVLGGAVLIVAGLALVVAYRIRRRRVSAVV